ncbi:MAG: homogentisate phytyltransferase [Bacteroidetes bacterium]|nr:MAG: homogentisate phytyltransferase [Bacteroidota bacterium]
MMTFSKTLWQFSRPHTIVGSTVSIGALYAIAVKTAAVPPQTPLFLLTLVSAICCNIFIVGLNQYVDVELDCINKPDLPMPAGKLTKKTALVIILVSLVLSLAVAATQSGFLLLLIGTINLIGAAYSLPPIHLKRHYSWAALSITLVRGILVNLGMTLHFFYVLTGKYQLPGHIIPLTVFVVGFSLGIAWFKDIPDTEGDAQFRFKTLALALSKQAAFNAGVVAVSLSYLVLLVSPFFVDMPINKGFYWLFEGMGLVAFLVTAYRLNLNEKLAVKQFYMLFWGLFFLQYFIYPLSYFL